MLGQFLQYDKVSQLHVYMGPLPLGPPAPCFPPFWIITEHRAELPAWYSSLLLPIHMAVSIGQSYSLNSAHPSFPSYVHKPILCVCFSKPALQLGTSVPFFSRFYMCAHTHTHTHIILYIYVNVSHSVMSDSL